MNKNERLIKDGAWNPLLFYRPRETNGEFSNFSRHRVILPHPWTGALTKYATSEHRYQALKAISAKDHDYVNEDPSPSVCKHRGGPKGIQLRPDWGNDYHDFCWWVMFEVVTAKVIQNPDVRDSLLASNVRHIYEDSPTDDIWGWRYGQSYTGKNLLGRCLMEVRSLIVNARI